ncbi:Holliday junction resolvase subunit mus81 [Cymbomonas tetramitiformis]|uniref:Crossover junction endonuclease MUS81 n=1 Tax=Cymbomonas tetramitiformis TaxID=36881 RepID=A0AAE0F9Z8_9CHLO|nr:Holliday junction resolvase subunit mus81 [Cymbomonas tetramitiformis]
MSGGVTDAAHRSREKWERDELPSTSCRCPANLPYIYFLEELQSDARAKAAAKGGGSSSSDNWLRSLALSIRELAKVPTHITNDRQARAVKFVGPLIGKMFVKYFQLYPPGSTVSAEVPAGATSGPATKAEDTAAAEPPKAKKQRKSTTKMWEPKYKTANFALLACMHRGLVQDSKSVWTKAELLKYTEESGFSRDSMYGQKNAAELGTRGYEYTGWSGFNKYLKNAPTGSQ